MSDDKPPFDNMRRPRRASLVGGMAMAAALASMGSLPSFGPGSRSSRKGHGRSMREKDGVFVDRSGRRYTKDAAGVIRRVKD